jgi:pimeloyl-ACP methyl ester carboxylesterase
MYTSISSIKINYEVFGEGESILLLHGWGGSLESLRNLGSRLKDKGFRVYLLDLPGFGKSDRPKRDLSLDNYATLVEKFLKEQGVDELYVFGHSFGGRVAIKLVLRKNLKIKKLILCNSSGIRKVKSQKSKIKTEEVNFVKRVLSLPGLKVIYPTLRKFFYYYVLRNRDYIDYPEIAGTYKKVIEEDLTLYLAEIDIPVLLIWGEKDKDTPIEHANIFKLRIDNSRLKIVKGEGHGLPKFKPELVAKITATFLQNE